MTENKLGILVHIGIDTIKLKGEGFKVHVAEKSVVKEKDTLISFNPKFIRDSGYSAIVPIILMDSRPGLFNLKKPLEVNSGEEIMQLSDMDLAKR